jgi:hypothetical protein
MVSHKIGGKVITFGHGQPIFGSFLLVFSVNHLT